MPRLPFVDPTSQPQGHFLVLGEGDPDVLPIPAGSVTVGRDFGCDVILGGADVSRQHCRLDLEPNGWHRVVDLESTCGVVVNGARVEQAKLRPFDRVQLGDWELLYLDSRTETAEVARVLAPRSESDLRSLSPPEQSRGSLRERLLWLTLMLQELRSEDELAPLLDSLFDELFRKPACVDRIVVVLLDEWTASGLRAVRLRNTPPDHVRAGALAPYLPLVRRALEEDHVLEQQTPLGPATVCVPMRSHWRIRETERRRYQPGSTEGALLLSAPGLSLRGEEKRLFQVLARQIAVLLSNVNLQRRATTDALTNLTNRAHSEQILRDEMSRSTTDGSPLSVLLIDLDDFKRINDTHGHETGDQVLRELALRLRSSLRLTDSAARWGGEEFLAILPGTDSVGAALVAGKLLQELRSSPFGPHELVVTASIGVACAPRDASDDTLLLRCADQALYHAKASGKDQLAVFDPALAQRSPERTERFPLKRRRKRTPLAWLVCEQLEPTPLRPGYTAVGRDPSNYCCLPSERVALRHAVISVTPAGRITYQDCSSEETFHNDEPLRRAAVLSVGDRLTIGPYEFVVSDAPGARSQPTRPDRATRAAERERKSSRHRVGADH